MYLQQRCPTHWGKEGLLEGTLGRFPKLKNRKQESGTNFLCACEQVTPITQFLSFPDGEQGLDTAHKGPGLSPATGLGRGHR